MNYDYTRYLHGPRGDRTVLVPTVAARWIYDACKLRDLPARARLDNPKIGAVLVALSMAALETSYRGNEAAPKPDIAIESPQQLNTRTAASRLGLTPRAIVHAISDGRLKATKDSEGRWRIELSDLEQYNR